MVEMRVRLLNAANQSQYPGVADSLPIFLLFNNGVDDANVGDAADWVTTNLVPFGDFDRDHSLTAADVPAMLQALANLNAFKSGNSLTDEDLIGFVRHQWRWRDRQRRYSSDVGLFDPWRHGRNRRVAAIRPRAVNARLADCGR